MKIVSGSLIILAMALYSAASLRAEEKPTFQGMLDRVSRMKECVLTDGYPTVTMFICKDILTNWYFTQPAHPAYPGFIKRTIYQGETGAWYAKEEGTSFASDEAQPAFKAWLKEFEELDRQMGEAMKLESGRHQDSGI